MDNGTQTERETHTGRKLYLVPLVLEIQDGPEGYAEKVAAYWREVGDHVSKLEANFGPVCKIYHESLIASGDEGLEILKHSNPQAHRMIDRKVKKGATLVSIEEAELLRETYDWGRCLAIVSSAKVLRQVSAAYQEASRKRSHQMAEALDRDLQDEEIALTILGQDHAIQFPNDIQVFYISPPSLDEIRRWLREQAEKHEGGAD